MSRDDYLAARPTLLICTTGHRRTPNALVHSTYKREENPKSILRLRVRRDTPLVESNGKHARRGDSAGVRYVHHYVCGAAGTQRLLVVWRRVEKLVGNLSAAHDYGDDC